MSNVIQFLEMLGKQADFGRGSATDYADAVARLEIDPALREALLRKDATAVSALLGGRTNVLILLAPAEEEQPEGEEPAKEEPAKEEPAHDEPRSAQACR